MHTNHYYNWWVLWLDSSFRVQWTIAFVNRVNFHHHRSLPNKCNEHLSVDFDHDQLKSPSHCDHGPPIHSPMHYSCCEEQQTHIWFNYGFNSQIIRIKMLYQMWWLGDGNPAKYKMFAPWTDLEIIARVHGNKIVKNEKCILFLQRIRGKIFIWVWI